MLWMETSAPVWVYWCASCTGVRFAADVIVVVCMPGSPSLSPANHFCPDSQPCRPVQKQIPLKQGTRCTHSMTGGSTRSYCLRPWAWAFSTNPSISGNRQRRGAGPQASTCHARQDLTSGTYQKYMTDSRRAGRAFGVCDGSDLSAKLE